ncbi:ferredoxin reductase family protein [Frankia sp. R82]|uniref:ferredoxin reductase family protein n=1 Tax=Frankia sp. R82 TaxID=2950553 RepID=UPI002043109F|nr:ferredoxin reductase family protein [Frankia sp. R82]MCM3882357.1 ferredoxin reductase family protein [Frankia sp. R82]
MLVVLAGLNLGAVTALALAGLATAGPGAAGLLTWAGRGAGLFAEVLIVAQVLLAARIPALERAVGQDTLMRWHRGLGQSTLAVVLAHPLLLAAGYGGAQVGGFLSQSWTLATTYLTATGGFLLVVVTATLSVRTARRRLKYETWYAVHLTTYLAILLAFGHQLAVGHDLAGSPLIALWWKGQLVAAAGCLLLFRIGLPLARSLRHRLRVVSVVAESDDVASVYLTGRHLDRLPAQGGQFLVWRFLHRRGWWQAHPYSLSAAPSGDVLRITVRAVGDGTRQLARMTPGTRVIFEGPYGIFTADARTRSRVLLIGAGVGITPIRALLEELPRSVDVVLLHRASDPSDAVLVDETRALVNARGARAWMVSGPRGQSADPDRPLGPNHVRALVPDVARRDVYLCGPPGFCAATIEVLRQLAVPDNQIHHESFEL